MTLRSIGKDQVKWTTSSATVKQMCGQMQKKRLDMLLYTSSRILSTIPSPNRLFHNTAIMPFIPKGQFSASSTSTLVSGTASWKVEAPPVLVAPSSRNRCDTGTLTSGICSPTPFLGSDGGEGVFWFRNSSPGGAIDLERWPRPSFRVERGRSNIWADVGRTDCGD